MTEFSNRVQRAVVDLETLSSSIRITAGERAFNAALLHYAAKLAVADCQDRLHAEDKLHAALRTVSLAFNLKHR